MIRVAALTNVELTQAALVGIYRTIRGKHFRDVSRDRKKEKQYSQWHIDIEAACAELAFAKHFKAYWSGIYMDTFKAPDVGNVQVRHTQLPNGRLVIRPADADAEPFALVVGEAPYFKIVGWILAKDGKQAKWLQPDKNEPFYLVPQADLIEFVDTDDWDESFNTEQ